MAISDDLANIAQTCEAGAHQVLARIVAMPPRPSDPAGAALWDQQAARLQGQLNSLTSTASKLAATSVTEGLKTYQTEMDQLAATSKAAEARIKQINEVSDLLTKMAKVLDLGLAVLAAVAAPSPATIAAAITAGAAVANGV